MKRCRMAVCKDQRGHMTGSHFKFKPGGRVWYGVGADGARELKEAFEEHKANLTEEEERVIARYERGGRSRWDRRF